MADACTLHNNFAVSWKNVHLYYAANNINMILQSYRGKAMRIRTIVGLVIFFAIIVSIICIIYDVHRTGKLSELSILLIIFLIIFFVGVSGISLTINHSFQLLKDMKNKSTYLVTEGNFLRSRYISVESRNADGHKSTGYNYEYTYEYIVEGKRYEYTDQISINLSEEPKTEEKRKIAVRYNPKNPEELILTKYNIFGIISGLLCLGVLAGILYAINKMGFGVHDIFRILGRK